MAKRNIKVSTPSSSSRSSISSEDRGIGQRLMHLRLEKGVDRKNLAIEAGVEEEEIAAYEEGDEAVPASLLLILAHSLNVHPGYFFNE